ncbi:hypothetical protein GGF31_005940 [Allomyces arbusculus]|nr:hypothetical protein GGF31_005940 [Allomyces arbusculus]
MTAASLDLLLVNLAPAALGDWDARLVNGEYPAVLAAFLPADSTPSAPFADALSTLSAALAAPHARLHVALASLLLFVQLNWTGPDLPASTTLPAIFTHDADALALLTADGEPAYHRTRSPALLAVALTLLCAPCEAADVRATANWWHARAVRLQQHLLDNPAASLRDLQLDLLTRVAAEVPESHALRAVLELEVALAYQQYKDDRDAVEHLEKAQTASGLKFEVSGLLGRRTRFQENSITQLVVLAESARVEEVKEVGVKTLALNDDTVLEKPKLEGDTARATQNLSVLDQCILLSYCEHVKNTNPADEITTEQMFPFVRRILENPNNWTVHSMALLLRSRLESNKTRTVERAALQIQALVDQIPRCDATKDDAPVSVRLQPIFAVSTPTRWALEAELADKMMSLGVVRTALDIFERLELWEKVVVCHMLTERKDKAEALVLQLLEKTPKDPKFLCMLGDIRTDPSLYQEAWDASNGRFSRAMRALGGHHYKAGRYAESVDCWLKALRINPLFDDAWFICGCAALHVENWDVAIEAFSRCTALDYENAEAWNNLATVYLRQKRKQEAYRALQQGIKAKYDSWKMWTNYMYLAVDLGHLDEAMQAMTRVLEIRGKNARGNAELEASARASADALVDAEVLRMIVDGILRLHAEQAVPKRIVRLRELVALATEVGATNPGAWKIAAYFYTQTGAPREAIDAHVRAYRCVAKDRYLEYAQFEAAVDAATELFEAYRDLGEREVEESGEMACADWLYQSKLIVRALLGRGKDFEGEAAYDKVQELMAEIKDLSR